MVSGHNSSSKLDDLDFDPVGVMEEREERSKRITKLIVGIILNLLIISIFLIIRFAHPTKPTFVLQDATVFTFNLSTTAAAAPLPASISLLSSTLQITIASLNPNDNSGIYYDDDLGIYAEYRNQQISYRTDIARVYQGHRETHVWSVLINGTDVPVAPYNVPALTRDQSNGIINIVVKLDGRVRWKIGSLNTRRYHIHVLCNAMIDFGVGGHAVTSNNGVFVFSPPVVKYMLNRRCSVTV